MKIGMVGLGKMGGNMVKKLILNNHQVVGYDINDKNVNDAVKEGAEGASSIEDLISKLEAPRNVWIMLPHGKPTEDTIINVNNKLSKNDVIIDGGNSHYASTLRMAQLCAEKGVGFLDAGVSGGIYGFSEGYNIMVGGDQKYFERIEPVFKALAPEKGYQLVGINGAGHFVKMMHNALEYVILEGIGETFECMKFSEFNVDLQKVADLWNHGSVVRCWLLELAGKIFEEEGNSLDGVAPYIDDSGTGRWASQYAIQNSIPVPAIAVSLFRRFSSRQQDPFSAKVIATLRNEFGGHKIKQETK